MTRDKHNPPEADPIRDKISAMFKLDCWVEADDITEILSFGDKAVPYFEEMLEKIFRESRDCDLESARPQTEWFAAIHSLCFLAHFGAPRSLKVVLSFLAQKQEVLDHWLHDVLSEDLWEIIFLLGRYCPDPLHEFVLDRAANLFSRLAAVTALVQIGIHNETAREDVIATFRKLLAMKHEDADFMGLVVSELLDLKAPELLQDMLRVLQEYDIPPQIITGDDVRHCMQNRAPRKLIPLDIRDRYRYFQQLAYFSKTTPGVSAKHATLRHLQKLLK